MNAPGPATYLEENAVSERAAEFFARRRFGNWGDEDQAELETWLGESTAHHVAYLRLESIAVRADHLAALRAFKLRKSAATKSERVFPYRRFALPLHAAASVVLFAALGFPYMNAWLRPADRTDSTDVGGRTLLSFADHTQIELNTDTALRVRMTTAERTVWLDKGEAWFHVAHDAAHPFSVIVGKHRITDLGTEFSVRREADDVKVALVSGRASLSGGTQTATLNPGDEALATPVSLSVTHKSEQDLADELAWRRGMLVFRNTPLAQVVREFNRYNATKLVIADPSIAGEKISADVRTDDYESFLELAEVTLRLRVDREGSVILISGRQKTKKAAHTRAGAP